MGGTMVYLESQIPYQEGGYIEILFPRINNYEDIPNEIESLLVLMRSEHSSSGSNNFETLIKKHVDISNQDIQKELERILVTMRSAPSSSYSNNLYIDTRKLHMGDDYIAIKKNTVTRSTCLDDLITDTKKLTKKGDDPTIKKNTCFHPSFWNRVCNECGIEANNNNTYASIIYDTSVPFRYIDEYLRYNRGEIARLKDKNTKDMLSQKKLHLVIDLDHTLLHSISPIELSENEKYLWNDKDLKCDVRIAELSYVSSVNKLTKTRPYVKEFLKEASSMFNMYAYTLSCRDYAKEMAQLLDPEGVYFGSRIVCSEDCTKHCIKSLDVILGKDTATLVLDDTKEVWPNHNRNLIGIERYFYFASGLPKSNRNVQSYAQMKISGGSEGDLSLSTTLEILKKVHTRFFEEHDQSKTLEKDVRDVLESVLESAL